MIYLATPYTDDDPNVREERYLLAMDIAQFFISGYYGVFSPIVHCHPMAKIHVLPKDYIFWKEYDETMMRPCKEVWFGLIPGYSKSAGMAYEFQLAERFEKPKRAVLPMPMYNWGNGKYVISDIQTGNFLRDPE